MLTSAAVPSEFEFESDWSSPVVFQAAHTPQGWIVAAVQHGVRAVLSLLDPELKLVRSRVVYSGKNCTWRSARPLTLPDGRCLLSVGAVSPANFELDLSTLELAAPPAWCACGGENHMVMQLAPLGERIILGIGDARRNRRLMSMPADARAAPAAFFEDFESQLTAAGSLFVGENSAFERMAALGDSLLLVHREFLKTKAVGHALLAVSSRGRLAQYRSMTAKPERARFSEDLQWFSDPRRKLALLYGGRVLEAVDAKLASRGRVDGHALFKALVPIAADGGGGLLWHGARKGRLVATRAAELDPRELASSVDQIAGQYASSATPKRAANSGTAPALRGGASLPARAKTSPIARPALDLAKLDDKHYRDSRDKMLAFANGTLEVEPLRVYGSVPSGAVRVAAFTSAIEPEHPVIAVSTRLAAQAETGEVATKLPGGGRQEVSFAVGAYTIALPVSGDGPNAHEWSEAWMRATIARDRASLDILEARPDTKIVSAGEDYRTPLRSAFIAVRRHPEKAKLAIERASELAQQQHVRYEDRNEIAALRAPLFPMLRALAARNERGFERALLHALASHKKFYSTPSRRLSQHGIIAWAPLALCCIARDLELRFEAETEYLPRVLL